ncbi:YesK family protein [Priestia sp. SB1]|uniref:YesK family protein n=1 Tax=Priestia sp. SB1 TaxID=3132359 RepID=UPI003177551A
MIGVPLLAALLPGAFIILLTWWFRKNETTLLLQVLPATLTIIAGLIYLYIGFVHIGGFAGAAYGYLAFFLILFAIIALALALRKVPTSSGNATPSK